MQSGVNNRELNLLYTKKPECNGQAGGFTSVGLFDCYFAFVIFGFGLAIALIVFLIEIAFQKYDVKAYLKKKLTNNTIHFMETSSIKDRINVIE